MRPPRRRVVRIHMLRTHVLKSYHTLPVMCFPCVLRVLCGALTGRVIYADKCSCYSRIAIAQPFSENSTHTHTRTLYTPIDLFKYTSLLFEHFPKITSSLGIILRCFGIFVRISGACTKDEKNINVRNLKKIIRLKCAHEFPLLICFLLCADFGAPKHKMMMVFFFLFIQTNPSYATRARIRVYIIQTSPHLQIELFTVQYKYI